MNYIFVFIFGIVIGSFLNVCIFRIPEGQSICYPPSHCGSCEHQLGVLDLVPVLSYIFLRGRCRYCKEKISIRYPLIELLNGLLYLIIYFKYGFNILTLKYFVLTSLLIVISMIDFDTQDVYTSTTIFGAVAGIIFVVIQQFVFKQGSLEYIIGGIVGAVIIGIVVFITRGMGEGDIEIAGVCGLFLGWKGILIALFLGIVIGGIVGIIILLLKIRNAKDRMAFGPFIAIGTIISMLYGSEILNAYLNFLY